MPKYDFGCPECGARYEVERQMTETTNPAPCPVCGTAGTRIYTMPKLLFKSGSPRCPPRLAQP